MKKVYYKIIGAVFFAAFACVVISCKPTAENITEEKIETIVKPGDKISDGITIEGKTYAKTSEVIIIPAGQKGVIDMKDDSSWNKYCPGTPNTIWKGVFIKDRKVTLSSFAMSQYEVTQELYEAVMEINPSFYKTNVEEGEIQNLRPVEYITHYQSIAFCNELTIKTMTEADVVYFSDEEKTIAYTKKDASDKKTPYMDNTKKGYRLPTEAEWEYAARGGNPNAEVWKNAYGKVNTKNDVMISDGSQLILKDENLATVGWYQGNSNTKTHEVGMKIANDLNLYDMIGNVFEWGWDWSTEEVETGAVIDPCGPDYGLKRVMLSSGYYESACFCIVSFRKNSIPDFYNANLGIRVCRSIY